MTKRYPKIMHLFLSILLILIIITIIVFGYHNYKLKNKLEKIQVAPYVYKAEDLEKIAKEKEIDVILNEQTGVWDNNKAKRLELICDLAIGGADEIDPKKDFYRVSAVAADNDGNIYVGEFSDGTIKKFDKFGNYILTIGRQGRGPGEMGFVFKFNFDSQNILHVLDNGNQRISHFTRNGKFLKSYQIKNKPIDRPNFILGKDDKYYISYYDRKTEKVIHVYSLDGTYLNSFGDSVVFEKPISHLFYNEIKNFSYGKLCLFNNKIYFTRKNPYEINVYNLNGELEKKILRKNTIITPVSVTIIGKDHYRYSMSSSSILIGIWNGFLINFIFVPPNISKEVGGYIDLFNINGELLSSLRIENELSFYSIDENGNFYGVENYDEIPKIVRYKLQIIDEKAGLIN